MDLRTRRRAPAPAAVKPTRESKDEISRPRQRGSTAVYEDMREDILSLKMAPGSPLDEIALARRFGLSRTPVREALLMLSRESLVTLLPNRSAIVTPHTMSNAHEYMDALVLLSRAVMRLAAEVRTEAALREIRARQDAYEEAARQADVHAILAADLGFHRAVSDASGNEFLGSFYRLSLDYGRRMRLLHYYPLFDAAERASSIAEHAQMADALEQGDAERSESLAGQHVFSELRVVQRSLEPKVGLKFTLGEGWRDAS
ncbi:MAG TPA: FCD domain-containing protein [Roseiarcus sp.]|nr:FCD domain-containing protein [Roseiarcus sp.]